MTRRHALLAALLSAVSLGAPLAAQTTVPAAAVPTPPPLPKGVPPFEVAQYNSFTWYGRFGFSNCAFVDMGDGVLVIDTGWTKADGENLKAQIRERTKGKPVKWIAMTQTDIDVNGGIEAFLPTDATIFVNARAADVLAGGVFAPAPGRKAPTVVGVVDHLVVRAGERRLELLAAPAPAHSEHDLVVLCNDNGLAFVGDLVTPGRCPNLLGPSSDPKTWMQMLEGIRKASPAGLVSTRGDPTRLVFQELEATRLYLERVTGFLAEQKQKDAPEARVAAELTLQKIVDYCPLPSDNANVLALYRRLQPDGTFAQPTAAGAAKAAPKPAASPR